MQAENIALLSRQKSLIYTTAMTFADFAAQSAMADLLYTRRHEIRLPTADQQFFAAYPDVEHWLIVVSDDSPDTAAVLPLLLRVAACSPRIDVRIMLDDDESLQHVSILVDDPSVSADLSDADLPLLLIFDDEWSYQEQWGPHPQAIEPYLDEWMAAHPDFEQLSEDDSPAAQASYEQLLDDLTQAMRLWYNSGLNQTAAGELRSILVLLQEDSDDSDEGE